MPRLPHIDLPNTCYHVLSRGNERRLVFEDEGDHNRFLKNLGKLPDRFGIEILCYVLMGNHFFWFGRKRRTCLKPCNGWAR